MRKRKSQKHAALTNNTTPTESLPDGRSEESQRSNHNRPKTRPGSKG